MTSQLMVVACYTNEIYLGFVLLKNGNMSIVKFRNLQPGLNTFCQNGEYLRMAGNIKASNPGVERRNKERFQICVFWSMRGASAYEFDQRLTFMEQIVPLPVPFLGSHSGYFHLP